VIEWLDEFYGDSLRETLLEALGPLFTRYALDVWRAEGGSGEPPAEFVRALAESYADHHLNSSRIQLQEVVTEAGTEGMLDALRDRFAEWADKRPGKVAANETVRTANAIAIEQMRSEGVVTKRWATSGSDSCPYCTSLDGTAVEIERPFFTPDDSYQPEGAETPLTFTSEIGGPPCHQGCVCSVVPG
jgi:hypothetical protein